MSAEQWPIDFDVLAIGDTVRAEDIERYCGLHKSDANYRIKGQLALIELIRKRRPDLEPYLRSCGYDVLVMQHGEAARHREKLGDQSLRRFISNHRRTLSIDVSALADEAKERYERTVYRHGRYVSAIAGTRKELRLEAVKASKPKLGE